ncbi:hypothetical protein LMG23994_00149 [Cupriavidus pinatubonensis]|uniref:Uncharacterized protein n=1 Tax=Cupriavidus pinatubonensis TaxID=248026 RepID=A0ABN7XR99_9BURK|nr:hypothetical protein LMG23994_00149 [Cupriavidus pinatubonensis]
MCRRHNQKKRGKAAPQVLSGPAESSAGLLPFADYLTPTAACLRSVSVVSPLPSWLQPGGITR